MRRPPRSKRTDNSFPTRRSSDLLRWQEGDQVMATFAEHLGVKVIRVDAAERYFAALAGIHDPEAKRKIIGRLFVEIFDEQARSEEHTSELQSLMRHSYAVFCLKKKTQYKEKLNESDRSKH